MSDTNLITKAQFKKKAAHVITLPSGSVVSIRIPNLAVLAKVGEIPNSLLKYAVPELRNAVATESAPDAPVTEDEIMNRVKGVADFQAWLVAKTVESPAITEDEVHDVVSVPDIEMLVEFALRQRDMDAIGHQIGGLETVDEFRRFRGLDASESDLLGI